MNIQGTFRKHSVRVERTPVSLHPNCKTHLKKVPRLTQNTTCKQEYLGRGLTRPGNIQGTFREHSGNIQGTFRERSVRVERTPVSLHSNCKKHFRERSVHIQGSFSAHSGNIGQLLLQRRHLLQERHLLRTTSTKGTVYQYVCTIL